jgi:hypothetical protein
MKPRRTWWSNFTFILKGGTEDNDLWATLDESEEGSPIMRSTWVPTDEERRRIANGENIELIVWGTVHPPVLLDVVDYPLGKKPEGAEDVESA